MRKISVFLFAALAMVACGNSSSNNSNNESTGIEEQVVDQETAEANDDDFAVNLPQAQMASANLLAGYLTGMRVSMYFFNGEADAQKVNDFVSALEDGYLGRESKNAYKLDEQVLQNARETGKSIRQQEQESGFFGFKGFTTNFDLIKEGFVKGLNGDTTSIKPQEAMEYMDNILMPLHTARQEAMKKKAVREGEEFLATNAQRPEVKTTESGLQYEVIVEGDGPKPTAESTVKVHYQGTLIDGTEFDSSYKRGEPISFPLNGVIKGWTEGLQLMPVGSKYKLYIPYQLGYGERGAGASIPPYAALIFTVELLDIEQ